jgi:hypothetical protein
MEREQSLRRQFERSLAESREQLLSHQERCSLLEAQVRALQHHLRAALALFAPAAPGEREEATPPRPAVR